MKTKKSFNNAGEDGKMPIEEFKLEDMCENPSIVMIAKRGSGKSWVCRAILNYYKNIPVGLVIAPTDRMNCFYGNFVPDSYIHYAYKSEIIEKLLRRQELIIEKLREKIIKGKKIDPRAFIVMDDCLSKKGTWMRDQPISTLLFDGRHYKLMYILTMQYPLGITPELRSNFDYIFLLAEDFITNLKRIYDNYAGMFPSFNAFKNVFAQLTENFNCMVIANRGARKSFSEKIFWYKAPMLKDEEITIGCRQYRKYHEKYYNKNWRYKHPGFDVTKYCQDKKNNKSSFKVEKINKRATAQKPMVQRSMGQKSIFQPRRQYKKRHDFDYDDENNFTPN